MYKFADDWHKQIEYIINYRYALCVCKKCIRTYKNLQMRSTSIKSFRLSFMIASTDTHILFEHILKRNARNSFYKCISTIQNNWRPTIFSKGRVGPNLPNFVSNTRVYNRSIRQRYVCKKCRERLHSLFGSPGMKYMMGESFKVIRSAHNRYLYCRNCNAIYSNRYPCLMTVGIFSCIDSMEIRQSMPFRNR